MPIMPVSNFYFKDLKEHIVYFGFTLNCSYFNPMPIEITNDVKSATSSEL